MLTIIQINYIRKLYFDKGYSFKRIQEATGHDYRTIKKYIEMDDFNNKPHINSRVSKSDLIRPFVREILLKDKDEKRKHRHTAKRIYKRALAEKPELCLIKERRMRDLVREEKVKLYQPSCFIDLQHPGGEAQVDFGEIYIYENEIRKKAHELVLVFPGSNAGFCQLTYSETMEALQEGLQQIFQHVGHVPNKIWFDQMAAACIREKDKDGNAIVSNRFLRFATHYGFEPVFCNPNSGHEKGAVEKKVGYFRNNIFKPFLHVKNINQVNQELLSECDADHERLHYKYGKAIQVLLALEKENMVPFNELPFDTAKYEKRRVNKYGYIRFETSTYSVSPKHVGVYVWVKITANKIILLDEEYREITRHKRFFEPKQESIHWIDFLDSVSKKPKALKYSGFYQGLHPVWQSYLANLDKEPLKEALRFLKYCMINESDETAIAVLSENQRLNVTAPEALWTTYYRIKEDTSIFSPAKETLPDLPAYETRLDTYDHLMGGARA